MSLYYPYPPSMCYTTNVDKSFPEHHYPLQQTRRKVGEFFKSIEGEQSFHVPKADIRETKEKFFIDAELPGVEDTEQLKLNWTNSRTLLLEAYFTRPHLPSADLPGAIGVNIQEKGLDEADSAQTIHVTLHERWQGRVVRAFSFPVDVKHDALKATLKAGLLRMTVPKIESSNAVEGTVIVE